MATRVQWRESWKLVFVSCPRGKLGFREIVGLSYHGISNLDNSLEAFCPTQLIFRGEKHVVFGE